jgi:D-glycero-alpha-D-manno-heptose 1-phosphate guanylyltransferase
LSVGGSAHSLAGLDAVILAGGRGTRLASLGPGQKVVRPVAGRPLLARLLDRLDVAGAARAVVAAGHRHAEVARVLAERRGRLEVVLSVEPQPLGTGGALALARAHVRSDPVLVLNGDTWASVDFAALRRAQSRAGASVTLAVVERPSCAAFGRVLLGAGDVVLGFDEKPDDDGPGWVSAGIYLFARAALADLGRPRSLSLERDVLPRRVGRGLRAARFRGPMLDIGTPASLRRAEAFFASEAPA